MRFAHIAFVLALLAPSVAAQDNGIAPVLSSSPVIINGQPVKGKVLEIDGKHFVAVEDLAQSLGGTIAYGHGQVALTLSELPPIPAQQPSPQLPSLAAAPTGTGIIRGTLTYFFDFHVGNKPDTGSKVWLVNGRVEIAADQTFIGTSTALGTAENPGQYIALRYSVADENGNFELRNVPPGEYTLILQSAHTVGTLNEKRNFFGRGSGHTARDSKGRFEFLSVIIKPGVTFDASKDFGPNIEM